MAPPDPQDPAGSSTGARTGIAALVAAICIVAGLWLLWPDAPQQTVGTPAPLKRAARPWAALPGAPQDEATAAVEKPQPVLAPDVARSLNAAVPFLTTSGPVARPFRFAGGSEDRARARVCLAAAALYEAGAGAKDGQKAVMQVVLNRVRHPAYPQGVCATVFQGSERSTGCQFTFTCDGALHRNYAPEQWRAAEKLADAALEGSVYAPVGLSTHYHTNWVHPYWSDSLDKLRQIDTHLFFRWRGFWGTRAAFARVPGGGEMRVGALGGIDPAHRTTDTSLPYALDTVKGNAAVEAGIIARLPQRSAIDPARLGVDDTSLGNAQVLFVHPQGGAYLMAVPSRMSLSTFRATATKLCRNQSYCRVQAWAQPDDVPRGFPISPPARKTMLFEYVRDGGEQARANCNLRAQSGPDTCLAGQ